MGARHESIQRHDVVTPFINRWMVRIVAVGWAATFLFFYAPGWLEDRLPVIEYHEKRFLEDEAVAGARVMLRVDRTMHRLCGRGVVSENWRQGNRWLDGRIRPAAGIAKKKGRATIEFPVQVPAKATPGRWCYAPAITYTCGDNVALTYEQGESCIKVR